MKSKMWTERAVCLAIVAALGLAAERLQAMFVQPELDIVPIDRVIRNLEQRAAADPSDVQTRLNLARVHAMAWASKSEQTPVLKKPFGKTPAGESYFGNAPGFQGVHIQTPTDTVEIGVAKEHLTHAIAEYQAVLKLDPANTVALLGQSWCFDQAGDKAKAIAGYRRVIEAVWPQENGGQLPYQNFKPTTVEVAGYLIPLLDPQKDATEIATLRSRMAQLADQMRTRPVTPIVIPLGRSDDLASLVDDRARVRFDADGSGLLKRWTWITRDAGWLIFDKQHRGQPSSALQLFGSVTFWLFWDNGYEAMRALDDNGDGSLAGAELDGLAVWRDLNGNGVADPGEVRSLASLGIVRLSCAYERPEDDPTMAAWSRAGVTFSNGVTRPTYDVILFPR